MFVRPATAWAAQRKQSIHQEKLFIFFVGVDRSSDTVSLGKKKRDHQTPFQWETHCLVPQELCTNQTMLSKGLRRLYQFRCTWRSSAGKWTPGVCSAVGPTPRHGDRLPEQRKRLGLGWAEKGVGKNPRNTKPNSKLYSANQFFDQKIQSRENHKVQKLF